MIVWSPSQIAGLMMVCCWRAGEGNKRPVEAFRMSHQSDASQGLHHAVSCCFSRQNLQNFPCISLLRHKWESWAAFLATGVLLQTLHLGLKGKLLCMPAQVASWLSLLGTVSHVSSCHDNFKEVNIIGKCMEMPNSKNLTEVCWGWITAITLFV